MKYKMKDEIRHTRLVFNNMKGIGRLSSLPEDKYLKLGDLYDYASMFVTKTIHEGNYDKKEIELIGTLQEYIDSYITLMQSNYYSLLNMRGDNVSLFYLSRIYQILFTLQSMKNTVLFDNISIIMRVERFSCAMRERLSKGMRYDWNNMVVHPFVLEIVMSDIYYKTAMERNFSYKDFYDIPHFQDEVVNRLNPKMIRTIQEEEKEKLQKKSRFFLDFYEKMKKIEKRLDKERLWVQGLFSYKLEALLKILLAKRDTIDTESAIVVINSLLNTLIQDIDYFDHSRSSVADTEVTHVMGRIWKIRVNLLTILRNL